MTRPSTRVLVSLFGIIALGPFAATALTACESSRTERPPAAPSATVAASSPPPASAVAADSARVATVMGSCVANEPPSASVSDPPPAKVQWYGGCATARNVAAFIDAHRTCATDADCVVETTGCGLPMACGVGIQRSAAAGLHAKAAEAERACAKAGVPMPCATCPAAPAPRCGAGYCRP